MTYHIFNLVWQPDYVRKFIELSLPFQLTAGNLPALASKAEVVYHIYTDVGSTAAFEPEIGALRQIAEVNFHLFEEMKVADTPLLDFIGELVSPEYKYELQRRCVIDLIERNFDGVDGGDSRIILLDSNFVLSNGVLKAVAVRNDQGYRAVMVDVLRVTDSGVNKLKSDGDPDSMLTTLLAHLSPLQFAYHLNSDKFTTYPNRIGRTVEGGGLIMRTFLPHPLMIPIDARCLKYQSTMDYDLALRASDDDQIYMCGSSGEMLVSKYSDAGHLSGLETGPPPSAEDLGLFILTCTNHRHRQFSDQTVTYQIGPANEAWRSAEAELYELINQAYAAVDRIAQNAGRLDAKFMMHIKSHFGPIEDFLSPQMEPAAMGRL